VAVVEALGDAGAPRRPRRPASITWSRSTMNSFRNTGSGTAIAAASQVDQAAAEIPAVGEHRIAAEAPAAS
jgi:hypothetical protein